MSVPLFIGDLAGTSEEEFSLGKEGHSIKKIEGEMGYEDPASGGPVTFASIIAGASQDRSIVTTEGSAVYDDDGDVVLKEA